MVSLRKLFSSGIIVQFVLIAQSQYCIPDPVNGTAAGIYIDGVQLEEINNTSSGYPADTNYTFYEWSSNRANLVPSLSYQLVQTSGTYGGTLYHAAWIDYNQDGDFLDSGERLGVETTSSSGGACIISFTVPAEALYNETRLRVRCIWNVPDPDPCINYGYGETEDYYVYINDFKREDVGFDAEYATVKFFNWDHDNDLDIININSSFEPITAFLYYNSVGNYLKYDNLVSPVMPLVDLPVIEVNDMNNDNYLDYIFMGEDRSDNSPYTQIYLKDGSYHNYFDAGIISLDWGNLAAADLNNDGKKDLIITGEDIDEENQTYIYENRIDTFLLVETDIPGLNYGSIKCADYDSDGDIDILISGRDTYGTQHVKIYRNDNDWNFTDTYAQLPQLKSGVMDWGDYDGDGDFDIVIAASETVEVYKNNGESNFTSITIYDNYIGNYIRWADMDNDGLLDIICEHENHIQIFYNNGDDTFLKHVFFVTSLANEFNYIDIGDYNYDQKLDILVNADSVYIYENHTINTNAKPTVPSNLNAVSGRPKYYSVTLSWDASTDDSTPQDGLTYNIRVGSAPGGSDIVSPTSTSSGLLAPGYGNVYSNTSWIISDLEPGVYYWSVQAVDNSFDVSSFAGEQTFEVYPPLTPTTFFADNTFPRVISGLDYDLDHDIDVIIDSSHNIQIFEQTTPLNFETKIIAKNRGVVGVSDINNDNYPDFLISWNDTLECLVNNRDKTFSTIHIDTIAASTSVIKDFDNDGDNDIIIYNTNYYLYVNEDSLSFTRYNLPLYDTLSYPTISGTDIDNDGDYDFVISAKEGQGFSFGETPGKTLVYENRGNMEFVLSQSLYPGLGATSVQFSGFILASIPPTITWNDYNKDNYIDLLVTGKDRYNNNHTIIYLNNGYGEFEELQIDIRPTSMHKPNWIDYNGDGEVDLILPKISSDIDNLIYLNSDDESYEGFSTNIDSLDKIYFTDLLDINGDNEQDIIYSLKYTVGDNYYFETYIEENTANLDNATPAPPSTLVTDIDSFTVRLSWNYGYDDHTGYDGSTYNIWVGTSIDNPDYLSPLADLSTGKGHFNKLGNCGTNNNFFIDNLPVGKYYWAVQTIDNAYNGGEWSELDSFIVSTINVDFTFDTVCKGNATKFTDNTAVAGEDSITNWLWDFGDGNTSSAQNPSHLYSEAGKYNVKLKVVSKLAELTDSQMVIVKYIPGANFNVSPVCHNTYSEFDDLTTSDSVTIVSYLWDFGDLITDTEVGSIEHLYAMPDTFMAELKVYSDNGCSDSIEKQVIVTENPDSYIAIPEEYSSIICEGDYTVLHSLYKDGNYNYRWKHTRDTNSFIEGQTADSLIVNGDQNGEGSYILRVDNSVGSLVCDSESPAVSVIVFPVPPQPVIEADIDNLCPFDEVEMVITNYDYQYDYRWIRNGSIIAGAIQDTLKGILSEGDYTVQASVGERCKILSEITNLEFRSDIEKPELIVFGPVVWYLGCTNDSANSYRWFYNGNLVPGSSVSSITKNLYMVDQDTGNYQLAIADDKGCIAFSDIVTIPSEKYKTGFNQSVRSKINIYPNPVQGSFTLKIENNYTGMVKVDFLSTDGRLVKSDIINKIEKNYIRDFNIEGLTKGVYNIRIRFDKSEYVIRLVKQ